jgi:hypothetical protein
VTWLVVAVSALGGGIIATLLDDAVKRRRAYRTALYLVRIELSFNATLIDKGKNALASTQGDEATAAEFKEKIFHVGSISTDRWDVQQPALVTRLSRQSHSLMAELSATYDVLKIFSATGTEPPDDCVADLRSLEKRLGTIDLQWREFIVVFLCEHRITRPIGKPLVLYLTRDKALKAGDGDELG